MRKTIYIVLTLFLVACGSDEVEIASNLKSDAHHIGKIVKVDRKNNRLFLEEIQNHLDQPLSKIWITINEETELLSDHNNEIKTTDLKKGDHVEVWNNGRILESNPGQTTAVKINKFY
ncbi:hypothetical protein AB685_08510 [Bacillus sp. LL01]|uniref:DUF3221 domain-containing protein n=1 Tax=Bacillus sp. LL01 TaxID=1665556 RepID=UPI00064D5A92|nr:DUF3221 domain-containing protein [Bacillus sp. LL01]KMJ59096.1 hypothetical protein AB685_08510 [Bacillus sp. LL01]